MEQKPLFKTLLHIIRIELGKFMNFILQRLLSEYRHVLDSDKGCPYQISSLQQPNLISYRPCYIELC